MAGCPTDLLRASCNQETCHKVTQNLRDQCGVFVKGRQEVLICRRGEELRGLFSGEEAGVRNRDERTKQFLYSISFI